MGTGAVSSSAGLNDYLGKYDRSAVHAVVDPVTVEPRLSRYSSSSGDGRQWLNMNTSPAINAVSISTTVVTSMVGVDSGSVPTSALVRIRVQLGCGASGARGKFHACLRDGD